MGGNIRCRSVVLCEQGEVVSSLLLFTTQMRPIMNNLLQYAIAFLVIAPIAAAVGFGGVAGVAMDGARILFWVFIILFVISLVGGLVRRS